MTAKTKEQEVEETLVKLSKYLEFYSYQANREALQKILSDFYNDAFNAGNKALEGTESKSDIVTPVVTSLTSTFKPDTVIE